MKLVTFNIRCSWSGDGVNSFLHRAGGIVSQINEKKPDVICFQECTDEIAAFLRSSLTDYTLVFNQRNSDRRGEGLAAALRKNSAELLGLEAFWLSPTPNLPGSRFEDQSSCPRICQCLTLRVENTVFRVYNLHLDHKGEGARQLGMGATLRRVSEDLAREDLPFFILGDFNATFDSFTIGLCKSNNFVELAELTADIDKTFHGYGRITGPYKIDYIFADRNTAAKAKSTATWLYEHEGIYLSDHYPIETEIAFN